MKTNELHYTVEKNYCKDGAILKMIVNIRLDDKCKNNVCDWGITALIYEKWHNRWREYMGGCCHKEILTQFPQFKNFIDLHLCDCYGAPLYAVENGYYIMHAKGIDAGRDYLRVTDEEVKLLYAAPDKDYFKYLLYTLGIVRRWNEESQAAIRELEKITGNEWSNPYSYEEERRHIKMFSDEEAKKMNEKIENGYYTPEAIEARKDEERKKAIEKSRNKIITDCATTIEKAENERDILLYILDSGLPVNNVIYYNHSNKVVFNWKEYDTKISTEDFNNFIKTLDYSKLPEGVKFEIE